MNEAQQVKKSQGDYSRGENQRCSLEREGIYVRMRNNSVSTV